MLTDFHRLLTSRAAKQIRRILVRGSVRLEILTFNRGRAFQKRFNVSLSSPTPPCPDPDTLKGEMVAAFSARYAMNSLPAPGAVCASMYLMIPSHDGVTVVAVSYVRIEATRWTHIPDVISHLSSPLRDRVTWIAAAMKVADGSRPEPAPNHRSD